MCVCVCVCVCVLSMFFVAQEQMAVFATAILGHDQTGQLQDLPSLIFAWLDGFRNKLLRPMGQRLKKLFYSGYKKVPGIYSFIYLFFSQDASRPSIDVTHYATPQWISSPPRCLMFAHHGMSSQCICCNNVLVWAPTGKCIWAAIAFPGK